MSEILSFSYHAFISFGYALFMRASAKLVGAALLVMGFVTGAVCYAALREGGHGTLIVAYLNVGGGDATLVETPSGRRILIDGGPDGSILRQLGVALPFYDRSFDLLVAQAETPQKVGGLSDVLARYSVATIVRPAAHSSAPQAQAFTGAVSNAQQNGARFVSARRGQVIDFGDGTLLEFLFPDRDASAMPASDGCLVFKLSFGATSFLFACGPPMIETYLAMLDGAKLHSDVLFATGGEPALFAGFVSPQFVVVPCGASATSSALEKLGIQALDTCDGAVVFVSDGQTVTRE